MGSTQRQERDSKVAFETWTWALAMTALDRAFIKAYTRTRRGVPAKPTESAAPRAGINFELRTSLNRIDLTAPAPVQVPEAVEPAASFHVASSPFAAALPSVEELDSHAAGISAVVDFAPVEPAVLPFAPVTVPVPASLPAPAIAPEPPIADIAMAELSTGLDAPATISLDREFEAAIEEHSATELDEIAVPALTISSLEEARSHVPAGPTRPLSAFAPPPEIEDRVRALLQVDRFVWPSDCESLCAGSHVALDGFVSRLLSGAAEGQRRVALVGFQSSAGRTTVAMCLARRAAAQDANWVLVDADLEQPEVARRLGIAVEAGWAGVLSGDQQLGDILIESIEDRFVIAPLETALLETGDLRPSQLATNFRAAVLFDMLANAYDLMLVDAGTPGRQGIDNLSAIGQAARLDAAYVVYDGRVTDATELAQYIERLCEAGVPVMGAIANFDPPPQNVEQQFS
jgi:Mrp family chromosome partitioning ATPase